MCAAVVLERQAPDYNKWLIIPFERKLPLEWNSQDEIDAEGLLTGIDG